jgi:hypothetical protein
LSNHNIILEVFSFFFAFYIDRSKPFEGNPPP